MFESPEDEDDLSQAQEGDYFEAHGVGTWIGPNLIPELTAEILEHALLRTHFFPSLNGNNPELPSLFTSDSFTPAVSRQLALLRIRDGKKGTDYIRFDQTKPDGHARHSGIPHPAAHARLVSLLADNWVQIQHITTNQQSPLRPILTKNGRLFSSSYANSSSENSSWSDVASTGAEFHVKSDIKSFFPSIYTHAFEWVPFGKLAAKRPKKQSPLDGHFAKHLDEALRFQNFGQTVGLVVGPGTSNIAAEYLLWPIDQQLCEEFGGRFRRRIDDYEFYARDESEAKRFIKKLEGLLRDSELYLNPQKTRLTSLAAPTEEPWKIALGSVDTNWLESPREFANYWQQVLIQFQLTKDQRCLRWGMTVILNRAEKTEHMPWALSLLVRQIRPFPFLAPYLRYAIGENLGERDLGELYSILESKFENLYSDAKVWLISILGVNNKLDNRIASLVMKDMDALSLTLLNEFQLITELELLSLLPDPDTNPHEADRYWLPRYQSSLRSKKVSDPEGVFEIMQKASVNFVKLEPIEKWGRNLG